MKNTKVELYQVVEVILYRLKTDCQWLAATTHEAWSNGVIRRIVLKCRFAVERINDWLDTFKAVLVRFEINAVHWKALYLMAFCVILLYQL